MFTNAAEETGSEYWSEIETDWAESWLVSVCFLCQALCESLSTLTIPPLIRRVVLTPALRLFGIYWQRSHLYTTLRHGTNILYFPAGAGLFFLHSVFLKCPVCFWLNCDPLTYFFLLQILEVPVTARDVEREHHSQLKRWKKNRGELNFKSPPRMHGARLIMLAEPPRRQDLQQNPTIVLEVPQPTPKLKKGKEEKRSKKRRSIKKPLPIEEIPNPYSLPTDPPPPPTTPPDPPPVSSRTLETVPEAESDSFDQQPPEELPPAKESTLQRSTNSLSSTEQDTYL